MEVKIVGILAVLLSARVGSDTPDVESNTPSNNATSTTPDDVLGNGLGGGPVERAKSRKEYHDLLGHTWMAFDMPNLDFYILPLLNYSSSMLQPYFSEVQVRYHWEGNMEAHRVQLNYALREWRQTDPDNEICRKSLHSMLESLEKIPRKYYDKIRNHGGAYVNHALFFGLLSGNYKEEMRFPAGQLRYDIEEYFQTFHQFKAKFNIAAGKLVGSGNVFLVRRQNGKLHIETMPDHDSPVMNGGYPLLVLDMWEHSWYLKHKHKRSAYADDWWMLVDWDQVAALDEYWKEYDRKKKLEMETEAEIRSVVEGDEKETGLREPEEETVTRDAVNEDEQSVKSEL